MRRIDVMAAVLSLGCGVAVVPTTPEASPASGATLTPAVVATQVVVISIDGLRPDALSHTPAPHLLALAARGAHSWTAHTVAPSNTLPAHVSMLSGYTPSVHGVTWDDYQPQRGSIAVSTIFSALRAAGLRSVMVAGKEKFHHFRDTAAIGTYVFAAGGDEEVANEAVAQTVTGFAFMFVHFPNVDQVGHAQGWMSPSYLWRITATDVAVGRLLAALPPEATIILTGDHGGRGRSHGTNDRLDTTIPWVIAGPTVVPGALSGRITTTDTAVTAAHLLGLSLPPDVSGRVIREALQASTSSDSHR